MKFRKLRIAWTILCVAASVVLLRLQHRSHDYRDELRVMLGGNRRIIVQSLYQELELVISKQAMPWLLGSSRIRQEDLRRTMPPTLYTDDKDTKRIYYRGFGFAFLSEQFIAISVPHWFAAAFAGAIGAAAWLPWHFSLRILLTATTLVAMLLGLIMWSMR